MSEIGFIPLSKVRELFGISEEVLWRLVAAARVRWFWNGPVQMFSGDNLSSALPQAPPATTIEPAPVMEAPAGEWVDYGWLWGHYGIKRGWLDNMVKDKAVKVRNDSGQGTLYSWPDIELHLDDHLDSMADNGNRFLSDRQETINKAAAVAAGMRKEWTR